MDLTEERSLIIVLDRTYSMTPAIEWIPSFLLKYVIGAVEHKQELSRVGLVLVDDHYSFPKRGCTAKHLPTVVSLGLTDNLEEFGWWIKNVQVGCGEDSPECLPCGWVAARKLDPNARIWIVTDSYPHGWQGPDHYPDGCPDGNIIPDGVGRVLFTVTNFSCPPDSWIDRGHHVVVSNGFDEHVAEQCLEIDQELNGSERRTRTPAETR